MAEMDPVHLSVRKTLRYAAVFGAALRVEQICQRLQGSFPASRQKVLRVLRQLPECVHSQGWWCLKDHLTKCRRPTEGIWKKKLLGAGEAAKVLARFPWVVGVWVTGSVAAENAEDDDDLDFLVVTRNNRLWLTRLFVVPLLKVFGVYQSKQGANAQLRHQSEEARDKWCLNLWLEESSLKVPKPQRSLYTAHEVLLAKPVFLRYVGLQEKFLRENDWIQKYFANHPVHRSVDEGGAGGSKKRASFLGNRLNELAYYIQLRFMSASRTSEKVRMNAAYFHPRDTKKMVMSRYRSLA